MWSVHSIGYYSAFKKKKIWNVFLTINLMLETETVLQFHVSNRNHCESKEILLLKRQRSYQPLRVSRGGNNLEVFLNLTLFSFLGFTIFRKIGCISTLGNLIPKNSFWNVCLHL